MVALAVIAVAFHARPDRLRHKIDYLGAALLAGGRSAPSCYGARPAVPRRATLPTPPRRGQAQGLLGKAN